MALAIRRPSDESRNAGGRCRKIRNTSNGWKHCWLPTVRTASSTRRVQESIAHQPPSVFNLDRLIGGVLLGLLGEFEPCVCLFEQNSLSPGVSIALATYRHTWA